MGWVAIARASSADPRPIVVIPPTAGVRRSASPSVTSNVAIPPVSPAPDRRSCGSIEPPRCTCAIRRRWPAVAPRPTVSWMSAKRPRVSWSRAARRAAPATGPSPPARVVTTAGSGSVQRSPSAATAALRTASSAWSSAAIIVSLVAAASPGTRPRVSASRRRPSDEAAARRLSPIAAPTAAGSRRAHRSRVAWACMPPRPPVSTSLASAGTRPRVGARSTSPQAACGARGPLAPARSSPIASSAARSDRLGEPKRRGDRRDAVARIVDRRHEDGDEVALDGRWRVPRGARGVPHGSTDTDPVEDRRGAGDAVEGGDDALDGLDRGGRARDGRSTRRGKAWAVGRRVAVDRETGCHVGGP